MSTSDWVGVSVIVFIIAGVVTLITFVNMAGDVEMFDPYPPREDCIMVDWEVNRVSGTDENKSGIYCMDTRYNK